jgi:pectin methylesterase-like acyl-CoA thioesterase
MKRIDAILLATVPFLTLAARATTIVYVGGTGTGHYTSLQAAVNALPSSGGEIEVEAGTYTGQATISKPNVWLIGEGSSPSATVLTASQSSSTAGSDEASATVNVTKAATGFYASNLSIENTFGAGTPAVALFLEADKSVVRNTNIIGYQDTLYAGSEGCSGSTCTPARQYFYQTYVQGNVDFIFGDAAAVFDSCTIQIDEHGSASGETTVTAQNRRFTNYLSGYVFWYSTIRSQSGSQTNDYLGRPWSSLAYVVSIDSSLTAPIATAGWIEWEPGTTNYLATAYYGEYGSTGTGALGYTDKQREKYAIYLTSTQANSYSPDTFLAGSDGWVPTSVTH